MMKPLIFLHLVFFLFWISSTLLAVTPVFKMDFDDTHQAIGGESLLHGEGKYIEGIQGKALLLSEGFLELIPKDNLNPQEGTATLWIKPQNWKWDNKEFIFFLSTDMKEKSERLILYKYQSPGLGLVFYFGNPDGKVKETYLYANSKLEDHQDEPWLCLGISWSSKQKLIALYVNGKMLASAALKETMFPGKMPGLFLNARPFQPLDRTLETGYDLLRIYDHALSESEMERLYKEDVSPQLKIPFEQTKPTLFTLPYLSIPPKMDGHFNDNEWSGAARLDGFSRISSPRLETDPASEVYAGFDNQNLYFCFCARIPGATQLVNERRERDSAVYSDDAVEILLEPSSVSSGYYQGIFNLAGAIYDSFGGDKKWNGNWEVKTSIYEGIWISEISIPLADFGTGYQENALWGFNFCRDRQVEPEILFSSISPSGMPFAGYLGQMRFSKHLPYARLALDYEALFQRRLEFKLEVRNPKETAESILLKIVTLHPDGSIRSSKSFSERISAGAGHVFEYSDPLHSFSSGIVRLDLEDAGGTSLFRQDIPLVFDDEVRITQSTDLQNQCLHLEVDLNSHYALKRAVFVHASLISKEGKSLQTVQLKGNPLSKGGIQLRDISKGDYTIVVDFSDVSGKSLLKYSFLYDHVGEILWLHEKPGEDAGVIWPYTPIQYSRNRLEVILRKHHFGKTLLPVQIAADKVNLFAEQPQLIVQTAGKRYQVNNFKFKTVEKDPDQCRMTFTASAGKIRIKGTLFFEYDGFFWYSMTLTGGGKSSNLEGLSLELKFPAEVAQFISAHFFARENVTGKLELPLSLKRFPSVWVGNLNAGFTFFLESFENWRNRDINQVYAFERQGGNVLWKISFVDRPVNIKECKNEELEFAFGIQANPVKPTPKNFRSWRVYNHSPYNISHPWQIDRKIKKYSGDGGFFTPMHTSMEDFRKEVMRFRKEGAELSLYLNPFLISPEATEYKIFRKEWRNPYNVYPQCPNSSFTDFIVWQIDDHIRNGGLQCVYVDSLGAVNCHNPLHGCGYFDEEGKVGLTYPIRGMRRYMKRIYSLLHADGRDQTKNFLWAHMSARTSAPLNAFVDFQASGEELEYLMATKSDYLELYSLDAWQVYFMKSSGVVPMFLPNLGRVGPKEARWQEKYNDEFLALALLHDTLLWNNWSHISYVNKLYTILDQFGYQDKALEFLSYRTQKAVTSISPNVPISIYKLKNKSMAVIVNLLNEERVVALQVNPAPLGLKESIHLQDLREGQIIQSEDPMKFSVNLKPYSFALVCITSNE